MYNRPALRPLLSFICSQKVSRRVLNELGRGQPLLQLLLGELALHVALQDQGRLLPLLVRDPLLGPVHECVDLLEGHPDALELHIEQDRAAEIYHGLRGLDRFAHLNYLLPGESEVLQALGHLVLRLHVALLNDVQLVEAFGVQEDLRLAEQHRLLTAGPLHVELDLLEES